MNILILDSSKQIVLTLKIAKSIRSLLKELQEDGNFNFFNVSNLPHAIMLLKQAPGLIIYNSDSVDHLTIVRYLKELKEKFKAKMVFISFSVKEIEAPTSNNLENYFHTTEENIIPEETINRTKQVLLDEFFVLTL